MKKLLMLFLLLVPLALMSCGSDDEPSSNSTKDPDGTMIVNLKYKSETYINDVFQTLSLGSDYNIYKGYGFWEFGIHIIGPVKGIGGINIDYKNISTWSVSASAMVGYGYVIRCRDGDGDYHYMYLYIDSEIVDTSGGVMGYRVKYLILN